MYSEVNSPNELQHSVSFLLKSVITHNLNNCPLKAKGDIEVSLTNSLLCYLPHPLLYTLLVIFVVVELREVIVLYKYLCNWNEYLTSFPNQLHNLLFYEF